MLQLFSKPKQKLAKNLSSHEFGCYMILLLFLNVPMSSPLLLKPLRVLYARHPRMVERLLIGSALINSDYAPTYKESIYKGIERGLQVGLISMTVCRILQKAGFSSKMYKLLTGETGCLLKVRERKGMAEPSSLVRARAPTTHPLRRASNARQSN